LPLSPTSSISAATAKVPSNALVSPELAHRSMSRSHTYSKRSRRMYSMDVRNSSPNAALGKEALLFSKRGRAGKYVSVKSAPEQTDADMLLHGVMEFLAEGGKKKKMPQLSSESPSNRRRMRRQSMAILQSPRAGRAGSGLSPATPRWSARRSSLAMPFEPMAEMSFKAALRKVGEYDNSESGGTWYRFREDLLRAACYKMLPSVQRAALHIQVIDLVQADTKAMEALVTRIKTGMDAEGCSEEDRAEAERAIVMLETCTSRAKQLLGYHHQMLSENRRRTHNSRERKSDRRRTPSPTKSNKRSFSRATTTVETVLNRKPTFHRLSSY
jgi:hypothetical protein